MILYLDRNLDDCVAIDIQSTSIFNAINQNEYLREKHQPTEIQSLLQKRIETIQRMLHKFEKDVTTKISKVPNRSPKIGCFIAEFVVF